MVASTDIKFYMHSNSSAPQLTNNYGCMIDVLDACLVNGFGSQAVATLTASGTTVTATYGSAHNYLQYQVTKIAGVNQTEFNGEHRILTVPDANTITFELAAVPSVTTATGTITSSLPSLGWLKPFSGTGKAAYRSANTLLASRPYLRVVDALAPAYTATYAKYAKVGIVEDMTDIDTMLGVQAPYDSDNPNKNWVGTGSGSSAINGWAKWYYAHQSQFTDNTSRSDAGSPAVGARNWILVGNKDYFYILPCSTTASLEALCYGFGAFDSILDADTSTTFLSSTILYHAANFSYARSRYSPLLTTQYQDTLLLQRSYNQVANYKLGGVYSLSASGNNVHTGGSNYFGPPSLANSIPFAPIFINEDVLRGEMKGIYWLFQQQPYSNYTVFNKNNSAYIACNVAPFPGTAGQLILKIGEL